MHRRARYPLLAFRRVAKRKSRRVADPSRPRRTGGHSDGYERSWERRALVGLVTLKVVGIVLVIDTMGEQAFDFPKSLFSRSVAWVMAGVLVAAVIRYGPAIVPWTRLHLAVIALALATVAAALVAEDHYIGLFGEWRRYLALTFLLDMVVLYLAVAAAFRHGRDWALLGAGAGVALAATMVYAAMQATGHDPIPWSDDPRPRPYSTVGNPDIYGQLLGGALAVAAGVALFTRHGLVRWLAAALAVGALAVSAIVATRGTVLGLAAAFVVAMIVALRDRPMWRSSRKARLALVGAVSVVALILLLTPLGARSLATLSGTAIADRLVIWRSAFGAFLARPLLGWGPDGMAVAYPAFTYPDSARILGFNSFLSSAHSWPLQAAATTGIVGLTALSLVVAGGGALLVRAPLPWRWLATPLLLGYVAYWTHGLVTVGSISVDWMPWLALGAAASFRADEADLPPLPVRRPDWRGVARGAFLTLALLAIGLELRPWGADRDALRSGQATVRRDGAAAVAAARSAVTTDPGRYRYWFILGEALDLQQRWKAAGDAYAEAAARTPYDPTTWESLSLSRSQQALAGDLSSGGEEAALEAARGAVRLDVHNAAAYAVLAEVLAAFGHHDDALAQAVIAIGLYQDDSRYDEIAARAANAANDKASALRLVETALVSKESATLEIVAARLALQLSDRAGALAHARRALELAPDSLDAKQVLAQAGGP